MRHIKLFENFSEGVSEDEIQRVIDYYKKPGFMSLWEEARRDFYTMASDEADDEYRQELLEGYPDWTEEDFKKVIIALDGEYEPTKYL